MIVVTGEALVDVVVSPEGGTARAPGGSPMNVAVGLARLGLPTGLLTCLGSDDDGDLVRAHLARSDVRLLGEHRSEHTGVAAARLSAAGEASYEFAITWDLPPCELDEKASGFHFGSLGAALEPGASNVLELARSARRRGVPVSYDPNVRPAITPDPDRAWAQVREHAALADLVRLSEEDAEFVQPGRSPEQVAGELLERGPAVVVVTTGEGPTVAVGRDARVRVALDPSHGTTAVVDTVGAGDSFMAALIASTLPLRQPGPARWMPDEPELERHVRAAHAAAAVTVSRPGADPPWRGELGPRWPG